MKTEPALCITLLLAMSGCSGGEARPSAPVQFTVTTTDLVDQDRFGLVLQSHDKRTLCLDVERWPNEQGGVHYGASFIHVEHDAGVLPLRDINMGYCHGGCGLIRIGPGTKIHAFIPYTEFGSVDAVRALQNRTLVYSLVPYPCSRR